MTPSEGAKLRRLTAELTKRRIEGLKLYIPLELQNNFHRSPTRWRLVRGSNRAGKTLCAAVECARAVTGQDPWDKYPLEDGRFFCIGKDQKHIGQVMYRKLFRPGAFKIIRDRDTQEWRAFRPWAPWDLANESKAKPAPPLIPPRMIESIAWENKKESVPNMVKLRNGWELSFFSSLGKPPQGSDIDGCWLDEEIVDPEWVPEMSMRLLDRNGKAFWSATPQAGTDQLYELHERAEDDRLKKKRRVDEFVVLLSDNPHIGEEEKEAASQDLDDEQRRVRIGGEFAITSFKIYPEFSMLLHGVDYFEVPPAWTRYMVVDPGHRVCAVLFGAVPPPDHGDFVYLYQELYISDCDAMKFAESVRNATHTQSIHSFIIDPHMAIHTELGSGQTVARQYSDALREKCVPSKTTGYNFKLACDDSKAGILKVHGWLRTRPDGTRKLRVLRGALPNFEYEIKRYHLKRVKSRVLDIPDNKRANHLMDCMNYLALEQPVYVKFTGKPRPSPIISILKAKNKRRAEKHGGMPGINLGPASYANNRS